MRSHLRNLLLASVALIAGAVAAAAQPLMVCNTNPCPQPPGVTSVISGGSLPAPHTFTINTRCPANFTILDEAPPPLGCCPTLIEPSANGCWSCTNVDPVLGVFTWTISVPNLCPRSTIVPSCPPAVVDLYFNVQGTIGAFPGSTFRSATCIHLRGNITTCLPFLCETFNLVNGPILFTDQFGNSFMLNNLTLVLNG
jgi:hypothetical protein